MSIVTQVPLIQCRYIKPASNEIVSYAKTLSGLSFNEIILKIISAPDDWGILVEHFVGDEYVSVGECFAKSVTLCSVFRCLGYSEKVCFVFITCSKNENFEEATHATLLIKKSDERYLIMDTTKKNINEALFHCKSLSGFTSNNRVICFFNDIYGFLLDEGVLENLPEL